MLAHDVYLNLILGFTGIDSAYEAPDNPELTVCTVNDSIGESVQKCVELLEKCVSNKYPHNANP